MIIVYKKKKMIINFLECFLLYKNGINLVSLNGFIKKK